MNTLKYVGRPETLGRIRNRCEQQGGCLIWQGATRNGHPTVYVGRQPWVGQRLVYALTHEEPAPYRRVGNTCGNPLCLNPKHLRLAEQVQRLPRAVQQQRAREKGGAESFGCVLAVLRVQKAVSMSRLGQKTGINHSYISRIEAGDRHPTRPVVLSFADALNCSPAERDRLLLAAGYAPLVVDEVPELRAFLEEAAGLPVDVLRESLQRARGGGGMSGCMVDGCTRPVVGFGFCNTHYERFTDHGDAYYGAPLSMREPGLWSALLSRPDETRHLGHCKQAGCPRCEAAAGFVRGLLEVGA